MYREWLAKVDTRQHYGNLQAAVRSLDNIVLDTCGVLELFGYGREKIRDIRRDEAQEMRRKIDDVASYLRQVADLFAVSENVILTDLVQQQIERHAGRVGSASDERVVDEHPLICRLYSDAGYRLNALVGQMKRAGRIIDTRTHRAELAELGRQLEDVHHLGNPGMADASVIWYAAKEASQGNLVGVLSQDRGLLRSLHAVAPEPKPIPLRIRQQYALPPQPVPKITVRHKDASVLPVSG